ncbi:MAG: hypothetical protein KAS32_29600, partial [Candidatus Peribacteraceae bacterium]|nr:hypothetical protein [Candidatus Peribacteraceae bacterium]
HTQESYDVIKSGLAKQLDINDTLRAEKTQLALDGNAASNNLLDKTKQYDYLTGVSDRRLTDLDNVRAERNKAQAYATDLERDTRRAVEGIRVVLSRLKPTGINSKDLCEALCLLTNQKSEEQKAVTGTTEREQALAVLLEEAEERADGLRSMIKVALPCLRRVRNVTRIGTKARSIVINVIDQLAKAIK